MPIDPTRSYPLQEVIDEIWFVASTSSGRVHVVRHKHLDPARHSASPPEALWLLDVALGAVVTWCGKEFHCREGAAQTATGITAFDDGRLCVRCHTLFPQAESHKLFEHPREED